MRAVMLEAPESMLAERRHLGLDRHDEMWDGVLHVVPPASGDHQVLGTGLLVALFPLVRRLGLVASYETGLFRTADDHRVPDLLVSTAQDRSPRGAEGAELVVEILSARDESYAKLDFYAATGVREVVVAHPADGCVELYRLAGERMLPVTADAEGGVRSDVLGVRFTTVAGRVRLAWDGGTADL